MSALPAGISTENAAFARKLFGMIRHLYDVTPEIVIQKNRRLKKNATYAVNWGASFSAIGQDIRPLKRHTRKKCCKKAALRGAFLAGGSVSDPEKLYQLELFCKKADVAAFIAETMSVFDLKPKAVDRGDYHVVYLKESDSIVKFLNVTGAHKALMSMENIRIIKDMRNNVNRIVNCETANVGKTVDASLRQLSNILYIRENTGFDELPDSLREIAELRIANRDIGLQELGLRLTPQLGKSGVNHRLRKLDRIADGIRASRESCSESHAESRSEELRESHAVGCVEELRERGGGESGCGR
jgi:DNA-binding protein WhiA